MGSIALFSKSHSLAFVQKMRLITQVGYENTSYFYRLFHERYGQSPREYRNARQRRTRA